MKNKNNNFIKLIANSYKLKAAQGFSAIEILTTIAIVGILIAISVSVFSSLSNSQSLDRDAQSVLSYIEKARTMAINSVDGVEHGVKFTASSIEVFSGTVYYADNVESSYDIPAKYTISDISLTGGATELYFAKLTGNASKSGTVTVSPAAGGADKTIVIYGTGISEIQ